MKAVIMAGGKGTRLQSISKDIPKPMIPILNKPILEYQIESLKKSGITDIIMIIGHLGHVIKDYFGDGQDWNVNISYIMETEPLGTAGALYYLKDLNMDDFFLVFGDILLDIDWNLFMKIHQSKDAAVTLFGHPNTHPYDSDVIVVDANMQVIGIDSKNNTRNYYYHNFVNGGVYCVSPMVLNLIDAPRPMDLEKHIIAGLLPQGKVFAYKSTEYVKDMGTPERLQAVTEDIKNGVLRMKSLKNKQSCIFLDRDGTINQKKGFLNSASQFELLPKVSEAIRAINSSGFLAVVATNQPVIARGECTFDELEQIHMKMEALLGQEGAYLDDIFFCPHHPHKGYEGEIPELKIDCDCRKPKSGMLLSAAQKYNIDLQKSWYIGDTTRDVQTGINAGMRTVLLLTGEAGQDGKYEVKADYTAHDLLEAVRYILYQNHISQEEYHID